MWHLLARPWNRLPFVARLLVTASFALLVAGATMLLVSARQEAIDANADLRGELARELENLPATLAEVVVIGDFSSLQQSLNRYVARPRVQRVQFEDVSGKRLVSHDQPVATIAPTWFSQLLDFQDVSGTNQVEVGGRNYGAITIELTAQEMANRAWLRLRDHIAILLLAITLDFLGIWLVLRSGLAPLRRMEQGADAIAAGALDTRLEIEGSAEMRHLIRSFNRMASATQEAELALRRANADLTRFAEVSAHHLMEPTRRLGSYAQLLRARLAALAECGGDAEVRSTLDIIERDASRLRVLVRDIQLFLAAGEARGEVRPEDANAALAGVIQRLSPRLDALGASVTADDLPPAVLDRPRLVDLFMVLLDNALVHGRPAAPDQAPHIHVHGEQAGPAHRYYISDNGPGIPASYRERVFEIFERLGNTAESGSGIGLAIARRIVASRNGRIWIEDAAAGGTSVVFELPDGE